MLELLLGQIPEALFFAFFMIFAKSIKEKRFIYILLMIAEYFILKSLIYFNIWFQVLYTFMTFITLKILYKEKSQVTDIFTFGIASIILIIIGGISFASFLLLKNFTSGIIATILMIAISRISMFLFIFLFRNRLGAIENIYKKLWNRNDKVKKKIKSTTFRSLNVIIFNLMFYIINLGMIYCIILKRGGV